MKVNVSICYESILGFSKAIKERDYMEGLNRYAELGYEVSLLKGKPHKLVENILNNILVTELNLVTYLGKLIITEQQDIQLGDFRLWFYENEINKNMSLLKQVYIPLVSHILEFDKTSVG